MKRGLLEKITVYGGGIILLLFVILSWVPSGCPVVRRALIGCPTVPLAHQTPEEQETNRVPHQVITNGSAEVEVKAEQNRGNTRIDFEYRADPKATITLAIQDGQTKVPLATVSSPLIPNDWHLFTSHDPDTALYTRDPVDQTTVADYLATNPPKLVADEAAARLYQLKSGSYTAFSSLSSLDGYNALLITHLPTQPDGTWSWFDQRVDLSTYKPDENNHLHFVISVTQQDGATPLLLGEVHVDYRK